MGKVGTGIGVTLGLLAVAGGATIGGLHIDKQNKDIKAKSAEIVKVTEDYQNSKDQVILLQSDNKKYEEQLAQKDEVIAGKDATIASKDAEITQKNTELASKEATISEQNQQLTQKDEAIASKDAEIAQKNQQIEDLQASSEVVLTTSQYYEVLISFDDCMHTYVANKDVTPIDANYLSKDNLNGALNGEFHPYFNLMKKYNFNYENIGTSYAQCLSTISLLSNCEISRKLVDKNLNEITNMDILNNDNGYHVCPLIDYQIDEETGGCTKLDLSFVLINCELLEDGSLLQPCSMDDGFNNYLGYNRLSQMNNGVSGIYLDSSGYIRYFTDETIITSDDAYNIIRNADYMSVLVTYKTDGTNYYVEFTKVGDTEPTLLKLENFTNLGI